MNISRIMSLLGEVAKASAPLTKVGLLVEAGLELAAVVEANMAEAKATANETDAEKLRLRAAELAAKNTQLSQTLDAALRG